MSDLEGSARKFLQRWSQRKRAVEKQPPDGADSSPEDKEIDAKARARSEAALPAFDPATLPPIESITATSDIRVFLAPGVPEELTRAALRRVWVTDPTIRDFVGIAENQWDFTKPDSVPGFGSLELTPELRRMVAGLIGDAPGQTTPQQFADAEPPEQIPEMSGELVPPAITLALIENGASAERSHAGSDLVSSADAPKDPTQVIQQDSNNDAAAQKSIGEAGESPQSAHRKHGGAVPK
jgi:hypothetical protein